MIFRALDLALGVGADTIPISRVCRQATATVGDGRVPEVPMEGALNPLPHSRRLAAGACLRLFVLRCW